MHADQVLAYRLGECAMCGRGVQTVGPTAQQVDLYVIGSTGTVAISAGLCQECQPSPASLRTTSARLAELIVAWYRATPTLWPTLTRASNDG